MTAGKGQSTYLILLLAGTLLPLWLFTGWLKGPTPNLSGFISLALANPVAQAFSIDLVISSLAFWLLAASELHRQGRSQAWLILLIGCNLGVGLSCALPLFLWLRARWIKARAET